jgi:hypothetical protein
LIWEDYSTVQSEYRRAENRLRRLADQREELEVSLGPSAIRYDKDIVQTSREDHTTAVLAKIADLDILIAQADKTVQLRREILSRQREILEASADIHDRIYVLYFLKRHGVRRIARTVGYSRSQTYEILKRMKHRTKTDY